MRLPPIADFCFLVEDVERSIAFYRDTIGFTLRTRAEGFADFTSQHVSLALWEIDHISRTVGLSGKRADPDVHKAVAAVEVKTGDEVDMLYRDLLARGVTFVSPPKDYPWRARCVYFTEPDNYVWEIYAWLDDRRFGEVGL